MKVIGIETRQGTFKNEAGQDVAYNTTYIHGTEKNENTVGERAVSYKLAKKIELKGVSRLVDAIGKDVFVCTSASQYGVTANAIVLA